MLGCVAIGAVTTIECIALFLKINGASLTAVVGTIAGIAGYTVGKAT